MAGDDRDGAGSVDDGDGILSAGELAAPPLADFDGDGKVETQSVATDDTGYYVARVATIDNIGDYGLKTSTM